MPWPALRCCFRKKLAGRKRQFTIPLGPVIPVATTVVFTFLAVGVFSQDYYAALWVAVGLAIIWWYVNRVVPVLKEKHRAARPSSRRRSRE